MDPDVENGPPVSGIFCSIPPVGELKLSEGADSKDTVTDRNTIPEDPERSAPPPPPGPESNASASNDFDERATEFWRVYTNEAQKYDEASIETWRADMKGIIIFVRSPPSTQDINRFLMRYPHQAGLYSAVLTAFIVESKKKLTPIPSDEIAYYARQSVTLLAQVSAQLAASGSPVPSTVLLPPAFPDFRAAQADIRVNVYWFMSLVFSLSAALAATLVQQWAREYLQYFRRYNHPLRLARIRQFLHEGTESWHMDLVVHLVPSLIHISLFLFFIGLADYLFKINIATATTTTVVIVICALCYLFSIIAPIWDAQSPYQSPLSPMFWRLVYWRIGRPTKKEHNTGGMDKPIDTDIKEGRVQLAMKSSDGRIDRDERAIEWIIEALTEDSNLERLVRNIPGSFESIWGKRVLKAVIDKKKKEDPGARLSTSLTVSSLIDLNSPKMLSIIGLHACSRRARIPAASLGEQSGNNAPALALVLLYRSCSPWNTSGPGFPKKISRPWHRCSSTSATLERSAMRRSEKRKLRERHFRNSIRPPPFAGHACRRL